METQNDKLKFKFSTKKLSWCGAEADIMAMLIKKWRTGMTSLGGQFCRRWCSQWGWHDKWPLDISSFAWGCCCKRTHRRWGGAVDGGSRVGPGEVSDCGPSFIKKILVLDECLRKNWLLASSDLATWYELYHMEARETVWCTSAASEN